MVVDRDPDYPEKPAIETINPEDTVGIDLGILKFTHDSDGVAVRPLDESADHECIEDRQRALSRKAYDSSNWETARRKLAEAYERLKHKRKDFREKLGRSYTQQYDAVFLEDLSVSGMLEGNRNGRNVASMWPSEARLLTRNLRFLVMAWRETIKTFERHGEKNGCHVVTVPPEGTTKRCANCGVESKKSLWVREHNCPACRYEADRDENASYNVQQLGLEELGIDYAVEELLGLGETEETPAETALPGSTTVEVDAKRVRQNRRFWLAARRSLATFERRGASFEPTKTLRVLVTSWKQEATGHRARGSSPSARCGRERAGQCDCSF